jgi:hypothetical protein
MLYNVLFYNTDPALTLEYYFERTRNVTSVAISIGNKSEILYNCLHFTLFETNGVFGGKNVPRIREYLSTIETSG